MTFLLVKMLLGAMFPIWLRAANAARLHFRFNVFFKENWHRMTLAAFGVGLFGLAQTLDDGFRDFLGTVGIPVAGVGPVVTGVVISSIIFTVTKKR